MPLKEVSLVYIKMFCVIQCLYQKNVNRGVSKKMKKGLYFFAPYNIQAEEKYKRIVGVPQGLGHFL